MNKLLEFIRDKFLNDWDLEDGRLVSSQRVYMIYENDRVLLEIFKNEQDPSIPHYYTHDTLDELSNIVRTLNSGDFEIIKEKGYPLALKTKYLYIFAAPRVNDELEDEEADPE